MRWTTHNILASLLIAGAAVILTMGAAVGQNAGLATQTDARGSITVKAVYVTPAYFKASPGDPLAGKVDLERALVFLIT
ncbi:MAG: hypothetical protein ACRDGM_01320, partial [bacterium]